MKPLAGFPGSSNWLVLAGDAVDAATGLGSRAESFKRTDAAAMGEWLQGSGFNNAAWIWAV